MFNIEDQAEELNKVIRAHSDALFNLFSSRGRCMYFPKKGLIAQGMDARGKEINATIGVALEEDRSPMRLSAIAEKINLEPQEVFPYATTYGKQALRERWQQMLYEKNPSLRQDSISTPLVTSALTHGLFVAGSLFMNEGDTVILPNLYWGNYKLVFAHSYGIQFRFYPFFKQNRLNIDGLVEAINMQTSGKRIVLLNFPNNPTGYTPSRQEALVLKEALSKTATEESPLILIFDDAYFGLVYEEDIYRQSLFAEMAAAHEHILAVKIDGATKEDYVWGFRIGFVTFGIKNGTPDLYRALEAKTAGAVRGTISNASSLSQSLLLHAFNSGSYQCEKEDKYNLLKKRYQTVKSILAGNPHYREYFEPLPYNSGYFMCLALKKSLNSESIRQHLLTRYDTGVVALEKILRIAYASTPLNQLPVLFDRVYQACRDLDA